jgi:hypothetical protein
VKILRDELEQRTIEYTQFVQIRERDRPEISASFDANILGEGSAAASARNLRRIGLSYKLVFPGFTHKRKAPLCVTCCIAMLE